MKARERWFELQKRIEDERCFGWDNQRKNPCDCPVDTCRVADWLDDKPPWRDEPKNELT